MVRSPSQARRDNRQLGITPAPGETHQGLGVRLPAEFDVAVSVFAKKLVKGVYYRETKTIFPNNGTLLLNWFTNSQLVNNTRYPAIELMDRFGGRIPVVQNGNKLLTDQFTYRVSFSIEHGLFALEAMFNGAFGFLVVASVLEGQLETMVTNLQATTGKTGPFQIIQPT